MSSPREGPNPLRPYYIPPSIGLPPEPPSSSSAPPRASSSKNVTAAGYASAARDAFIDIDYSDYVSEGSQSTLDMIKELLDQALYKYLSVLLAQPFDNAKTILQVRSQAGGGTGSISLVDMEDTGEEYSAYRASSHDDYLSDESDPDEPAYFASSAPSSFPHSPSRSRRHRAMDHAGHALPSPSSSQGKHQLVLKRPDSIMEVLTQLWTKEGAWGIWKGSNATFVYSVIFKTVETWTRSMIAAVVNVPDPGLIAGLGMTFDVADSPYPWASLGVAVAAAGIAGILLAPMDVVRTKLILISTSTPRRGYLHNLRLLPSYFCPTSLIVPTLLHSTISPLMTHATSLLLRSRLAIDPILTPLTFSLATFCTSAVELLLKLPCETVLRRGQMAVISSPSYLGGRQHLDMIVDAGQYRGTLRTMWLIARKEGFSETVTSKSIVQAGKRSHGLSERKGQGIEGLWRGWRVGFWGLVGIWGAAALGGASGGGGEF